MHLKSNGVITIQSWDTLYITIKDNNVIVKDGKGKVFKFEVDKEGEGEYGSDLVISEHNRYHACGDLEKGPCCSGAVIMDEK